MIVDEDKPAISDERKLIFFVKSESTCFGGSKPTLSRAQIGQIVEGIEMSSLHSRIGSSLVECKGVCFV